MLQRPTLRLLRQNVKLNSKLKRLLSRKKSLMLLFVRKLMLSYMLRSRLYRRLPAFAVHASFAVILAGALTSWLTSEHGTLRLKDGAEASAFTLDDGSVAKMPFSLKLQRFEIEYYAGTEAPMDFVSHL